ncbi:MAG: helix-turn-helix domain-containing protein [Opitutaceae bacterium]
MHYHGVKQISESVAARAKLRRQEQKWTQEQLSEHAGIPLSTYKRFEQKGLISFEGLIKVAMALRLELGFQELFLSKKSEFQTLDDVEKAFSSPTNRPNRKH